MVAIVGPSGAGKSTIVNLLLRLYDVNAGEITVAGTDIRDFDLTYLRSNIGVVTQDAYLFNGTIRENLLYAKPDATQQEMEAACRLANIHEFIVAQEKGYDTMVGNRGSNFPVGRSSASPLRGCAQESKDSRAGRSDLVAGLHFGKRNSKRAGSGDARQDQRGNRARLTTVLAADWILVVKDGIICEQGTHDRLLEQNGVYRELYETQFKRVLEHEGIKKPPVKTGGFFFYAYLNRIETDL
jgi:ATP-binding cassette subfamily B protein